MVGEPIFDSEFCITKKTAWLLMMPDPVEVSGTSDVQDIPGFGLRQPRAVKRASV